MDDKTLAKKIERGPKEFKRKKDEPGNGQTFFKIRSRSLPGKTVAAV